MQITLATLPKASPQEVYDHVVRGLASQHFQQSIDEGGHCAYRGEHGRKCSAGHCMSDAEYVALMAEPRMASAMPTGIEGAKWRDLAGHSTSGDSFDPVVPETHHELIDALQTAHDNGAHPKVMREQLVDVASRLGLATDVLNGLDSVGAA